MGDQHQGRAVGARQLEQQVHDLLAGGAVEIAGRLVGQQQLRPADEGARHRHPLLLAARKLGRIVAEAMAEADALAAPPRRSSKASPRPANSSGSATFSCAVMVGMRWKPWNTMPIWSRRRRARASSSSGPRSRPATSTRPDVARSSPPATIIRLDLPAPEGPTTAAISPAGDIERDAAQDIDHAGIACHVEMDVGEADDG